MEYSKKMTTYPTVNSVYYNIIVYETYPVGSKKLLSLGVEPRISTLLVWRLTNLAIKAVIFENVIEKVRKRFLIKLDLSLLIYIIKAWFHLQSEV